MPRESFEATADSVAPHLDELDDVTSYEDDGDLVICDRTNPKAWISSDETTSLAP